MKVIFLAVSTLCMSLTCVQALLSVPDSNIIQRSTIDFNNAMNAWLMHFDALPEHNHLLVQVCNASSYECGIADSVSSDLNSFISCAQLQSLVQDPKWNHGSVTPTHECIPSGDDDVLDGVFTEVFPNAIKIGNKIDDLLSYGLFANETLTLEMRILFVLDPNDSDSTHNRLYTMHEYRETLSLRVPTLLYGTVIFNHECPQRGLYTPPKATLHLQQWKDITDPSQMPCMWECNPSHVRYPFNSFPPGATDANLSGYVCQPLPADFTSVQFKFSLYVDSGNSENGEYTDSFFQSVDALADNMQVDIQSSFNTDILVVLMIPGTVFSHRLNGDIGQLLRNHAAFSGRFGEGEWESIKLQPSRRLLQSEVEVTGVMVAADTSITDIAGLRRTVSTKADSNLQTFTWPESTAVQSTSEASVVITGLQRASKTPQAAESIFNDSFFYGFMFTCAGLVAFKIILVPVSRRHHSKR